MSPKAMIPPGNVRIAPMPKEKPDKNTRSSGRRIGISPGTLRQYSKFQGNIRRLLLPDKPTLSCKQSLVNNRDKTPDIFGVTLAFRDEIKRILSIHLHKLCLLQDKADLPAVCNKRASRIPKRAGFNHSSINKVVRAKPS